MNEKGKSVKDPMPDEFASREEEAEFWDTHDIADYWHELKPVELEFSGKLAQGPCGSI